MVDLFSGVYFKYILKYYHPNIHKNIETKKPVITLRNISKT